MSHNLRTRLTADSKKLSADGKAIVEALSIELESFRAEFSVLLESKTKRMLDEFNAVVATKDVEIKKLKEEASSLKGNLTMLETKLDEAEAYSRRDCLVLSGPGIPNKSIEENSVQVVLNILDTKLGVKLAPTDLSTAHRIGSKGDLIVKVCRRDDKTKILKASRSQNKTSPQKIYVQDSLTPARSNLYYLLRKLKKDHPQLIKGCSTQNGAPVVFSKPLPGAERDQRHVITTRPKLEKFCNEIIKVNLDSFLDAGSVASGSS